MEHLVQSHLGGYYISDNDPKFIERFCEQCGDSDWIIISWKKGNKMNALLDHFGRIKEDSNDIELDKNDNISRDEMINDLMWEYFEDRYMINILFENELITKEEQIKLLKQVSISQKKQFELLKSIYYKDGYVRVRNK